MKVKGRYTYKIGKGLLSKRKWSFGVKELFFNEAWFGR